MRPWVPVLLVVMLTCSAAPCQAQGVRFEDKVSGGAVRRANGLAEEANLSEWPTLEEGTTGTQIVVSADYHNSDLVIRTFKSYGRDRLLELGKRLAVALDRPATDFIVSTGRRLIEVDLEFNDFIRVDGPTSHSEIDLERAVRFLEDSDLPQPMGVYIDVNDGQLVEMAGKPISESQALRPSGVDGAVSYSTTRHWYGLLMALLMAAMFLATPVLMFRAGYLMTNRNRQVKPTPEEPPSSSTLEEAQRKYEEGRPKGLKGWLLFAALLAPLLLFSFMRPAMSDMINWMPNSVASPLSALMIPVLFFLPGAVGATVGWVRRRRDPIPAKEQESTSSHTTTMRYMGVTAGVMLLVVMLLPFAAGPMRSVPLWLLRSLPFALPGSFLVGLVIVARKEHRRTHTRLEPGDPDFDFAVSTVEAAGVRVRGIYVKDADEVNAYATLWGNVGLTRGAREKLEPHERRAILAHEIGHVRGRHVPVLFAVSLGFAAVWIRWAQVAGRVDEIALPGMAPRHAASPVPPAGRLFPALHPRNGVSAQASRVLGRPLRAGNDGQLRNRGPRPRASHAAQRQSPHARQVRRAVLDAPQPDEAPRLAPRDSRADGASCVRRVHARPLRRLEQLVQLVSSWQLAVGSWRIAARGRIDAPRKSEFSICQLPTAN